MRMLKPYGLSHLVALVLLSLQAHAALYPLELGNLETAHDDNPAQLTAEETEQLNEYEFEDEICTTFHDIEPLISLASCSQQFYTCFERGYNDVYLCEGCSLVVDPESGLVSDKLDTDCGCSCCWYHYLFNYCFKNLCTDGKELARIQFYYRNLCKDFPHQTHLKPYIETDLELKPSDSIKLFSSGHGTLYRSLEEEEKEDLFDYLSGAFDFDTLELALSELEKRSVELKSRRSFTSACVELGQCSSTDPAETNTKTSQDDAPFYAESELDCIDIGIQNRDIDGWSTRLDHADEDRSDSRAFKSSFFDLNSQVLIEELSQARKQRFKYPLIDLGDGFDQNLPVAETSDFSPYPDVSNVSTRECKLFEGPLPVISDDLKGASSSISTEPTGINDYLQETNDVVNEDEVLDDVLLEEGNELLEEDDVIGAEFGVLEYLSDIVAKREDFSLNAQVKISHNYDDVKASIREFHSKVPESSPSYSTGTCDREAVQSCIENGIEKLADDPRRLCPYCQNDNSFDECRGACLFGRYFSKTCYDPNCYDLSEKFRYKRYVREVCNTKPITKFLARREQSSQINSLDNHDQPMYRNQKIQKVEGQVQELDLFAGFEDLQAITELHEQNRSPRNIHVDSLESRRQSLLRTDVQRTFGKRDSSDMEDVKLDTIDKLTKGIGSIHKALSQGRKHIKDGLFIPNEEKKEPFSILDCKKNQKLPTDFDRDVSPILRKKKAQRRVVTKKGSDKEIPYWRKSKKRTSLSKGPIRNGIGAPTSADVKDRLHGRGVRETRISRERTVLNSREVLHKRDFTQFLSAGFISSSAQTKTAKYKTIRRTIFSYVSGGAPSTVTIHTITKSKNAITTTALATSESALRSSSSVTGSLPYSRHFDPATSSTGPSYSQHFGHYPDITTVVNTNVTTVVATIGTTESGVIYETVTPSITKEISTDTTTVVSTNHTTLDEVIYESLTPTITTVVCTGTTTAISTIQNTQTEVIYETLTATITTVVCTETTTAISTIQNTQTEVIYEPVSPSITTVGSTYTTTLPATIVTTESDVIYETVTETGPDCSYETVTSIKTRFRPIPTTVTEYEDYSTLVTTVYDDTLTEVITKKTVIRYRDTETETVTEPVTETSRTTRTQYVANTTLTEYEESDETVYITLTETTTYSETDYDTIYSDTKVVTSTVPSGTSTTTTYKKTAYRFKKTTEVTVTSTETTTEDWVKTRWYPETTVTEYDDTETTTKYKWYPKWKTEYDTETTTTTTTVTSMTTASPVMIAPVVGRPTPGLATIVIRDLPSLVGRDSYVDVSGDEVAKEEEEEEDDDDDKIIVIEEVVMMVPFPDSTVLTLEEESEGSDVVYEFDDDDIALDELLEQDGIIEPSQNGPFNYTRQPKEYNKSSNGFFESRAAKPSVDTLVLYSGVFGLCAVLAVFVMGSGHRVAEEGNFAPGSGVQNDREDVNEDPELD